MANDEALAPIKFGSHTVPGIWRWMFPEDIFYFRVDPEIKATCFNCPQVKAKGFHPAVRCCTVIPRIPNFLMGMALTDPKAEKLVSAYVQSGYALPEGTNITPHQLVRSLEYIVKPNRAEPSLVCPFLDGRSKECQVYAFRTTVCSSFFCHNDSGEAGQLFWNDLQDLGSQIEAALGQWSLAEAGFDVPAYFARFNSLTHEVCSEPGTDAWSLEVRRILFQEWFGKELDLYRACAAAVLAHKKDLFGIASRQVVLQTKHFDEKARQSLTPHFPAHLIEEALPEGQPETIQNLWYSLQLSHRNLQLARSHL